MKFKKFLQGQADIIKKVEQRRSNLTGGKAQNGNGSKNGNYSYNPVPNNDDDEDVNISISTQSTMQMSTDRNQYYQERVNDVQSIEKSMNELSTLMTKVSQLTYDQRIMIDK
jgi:hypothetical protein